MGQLTKLYIDSRLDQSINARFSEVDNYTMVIQENDFVLRMYTLKYMGLKWDGDVTANRSKKYVSISIYKEKETGTEEEREAERKMI